MPGGDYTGGTIDALLPEEYQKLPPSRLALIFDAYDELPANVRSTFEKELNSWTKKNTLARILISSRGNFCKSEEGSHSRTFPGFAAYDICALTSENITALLETRCINPDVFYQAAQASQVESLLQNPFWPHSAFQNCLWMRPSLISY